MKFHIKVTRKDGVESEYTSNGFCSMPTMFYIFSKGLRPVEIEMKTIANIEITPL